MYGCKENRGYVPKVEKDFRKVLEDKKVDCRFHSHTRTLAGPYGHHGLTGRQACLCRKTM